MTYSSLDAIGLKYATDKSSAHHDYLQFYEMFFAPVRALNLKILEIGVSSGASLQTWHEYFPKSEIVGIDIVGASKRFERDRIVIEIVDQSNVEGLTKIAVKHGPFDIIIEDGSHMWEHQITTLRTLFPFVKNGGLYIVEDLQTNYGSYVKDYRGVASSSCVDFLKSWLDLRVADEQIQIDLVEDAFLRTYGRAAHFLTFYSRACLIKKQVRPITIGPDVGSPLLVPTSDALQVEVLAHMSNLGDVVGINSFINLNSDLYPFQGLLLRSDGNLLAYRIAWPDHSWSEWANDGEFTGTRGQSKLLTGVTVRLRNDVSDKYTLRTICRFVGSHETFSVADGEDCLSPTGRPLCGIQICLEKWT